MEKCGTCFWCQNGKCTNENSPMLGVSLKPCFSCDKWKKK